MTKVEPIDDTQNLCYKNSTNEHIGENDTSAFSEKGEVYKNHDEESGEFNRTDDDKRKRVSRRKTCCTVFAALLTRLLFLAHGVIAAWRAAEVAGLVWWALLGGVALMLVESGVVLIARKGREFKVFYPSVLLFLCTSVSSIWLLKLTRFNQQSSSVNQTVTNVSSEQGSGLPFQIPIQLEEEAWLMALEQSLMVILIVARWLRPKGSLTREELSSLLLVYVGMAADIIDLFDIFEHESVLTHNDFIIAVLVVWTLSLLQFVFVFNASGGSSSETSQTSPDSNNEGTPDTKTRGFAVREFCSNREMWCIVWSLVMQDGPFLGVRLTAIISYQVYSYSNLFFTFKNSLVILLQTYRLLAITCWVDDVDEVTKKVD